MPWGKLPSASGVRALLALLLLICPFAAHPTGTAFTYQGRLNQGGGPATGDYDFQFLLFDSPDFVAGNLLSGPVTVQDHAVTEGLFAVEVDFGASAFGALDVWLEVRVREGSSAGPFTTLAPRQKITPVPLALSAATVELGAVGSEHLATGAVGSDQIADASIAGGDVDADQVQLRIGATCAAGSAIRAIANDGTVICEADSDTTYSAGFGLELTSNELSVDAASVQARVTGTCPAGQFMVAINANGSVSCAAPPVDCSQELVCPTPLSGTVCLAGSLSDAEDAGPLQATVAPGSACGEGAEGGPCDLVLQVHDAVAFAANPAGSIPLAHGGLRVDGCGRFRFEHLNPPGSGLAALTVDDAGAVHALSAHFLPLVASEVIEQFGALAVKASTVQMWTDSAGSPFGLATFAEYGVLFATYRYHGSPAVGVTATRDGSPQPADDYYFSDTSEDSRGTIDPAQTSTGANGSALLVDSGLVTHSGTGGEIGGCAWTERLAATIAGVVAIAEFSCVP